MAAVLPWTRRRTPLSELPASQQRMALTETVAHLEELRARGLARRYERDGLLCYEPSSG